MNIIEHFLKIVAPFACIGCKAEGQILCDDCVVKMSPSVERCFRCQKASPNGVTCVSCRRRSSLSGVKTLTAYEGVAKQLIWKLKFERARQAGSVIGTRLVPLVNAAPDALLVHAPTANARVRQRGYDQAALIARVLSRKTHIPHASLLVRIGRQKQRGAGRLQRQKQLEGALRVRQPYRIKNAHIILVDDVITTGATLEAAASVLKAAGARKVEAVTFAQA